MGKILVTGADGFIGSHLVEMLVNSGFKVRALSYYNSFNFWGWLEETSCISDIEVVPGDIRDPHFCGEITKNIDVVFHLAALIAIPYSYRSPDSYVDTNVKGTLNICQAGMRNGVKRIIHLSTSEVYGSAQYVPIDENHPLQAQSPYSASKIGADAVARSFYYSYELPVVIARPFNTYGPRQSLRAIIPTIITQILSGKKEIILGDIRPTRDFTYVEETCKALIMLMKSDNAVGEVVNIGLGFEISIGELFLLLKKICGSNVTLVKSEERFRPQNSEVMRLFCNNKKLAEITGYKPELSLEDGLAKTIAWYSKDENLRKFKKDVYNV